MQLISSKIIIIFLMMLSGCTLLRSHEEITSDQTSTAGLSNSFQTEGSRNKNDCGPIAELQVLGYLGYTYTYQEIVEEIHWDRDWPDLTDSIVNHDSMLKSFNIPHEIFITGLKFSHIVERLNANKPSIIMVHTEATGFHWVVFIGVMDNSIYLAWGDNTVRVVPIKEFNNIFIPSGITYK